MERHLLWGVLALGSVGWLAGRLLNWEGARERVRRGTVAFTLLAIVLLVAVAAIAVPARPVWPAGQPWGRGVVVGGVAALLAAWVLLGAGRESTASPRALRRAGRDAAPLFAGLVPVAAAFLWSGAAAVDASVGVATGWFVVSLLVAAGVAAGLGARATDKAGQTNQAPLDDDLPVALLMNAGFVVTLCATAALGHYRDAAGTQPLRWVLSALLLATGVAVLTLLAGIASPGRTRDRTRAAAPGIAILQVALPALLLLGLAHVVAASLVGQTRLTLAAASGLMMILLAWWVASEPDAGAAGTRRATVTPVYPGAGPTAEHVMALLLGLAGVVVAFYLLTGYGIGAMLIAAWLPAGTIVAHRDDAGRARLAQILVFGVILLLYRLFTQRFQDDLSGATLVDHFALFSIVAGIALPLLLSGVLGRSGPGISDPGGTVRVAPSVAGGISRLAIVILLAVAVSTAMLVLWGPQAAIGLLTGLALASVLYPGVLSHGWMALLTALPVVQWTHDALRLALLTRDDRLRLLLILAAVVAVLILAADLVPRIAVRLRRRGRAPVAPGTREGVQP
ncbi:MAG: hypothetical protein QN178_02945 [Armatimonadota bacterium]|nr:hypothetical protein [Armatimonadota bacterium]